MLEALPPAAIAVLAVAWFAAFFVALWCVVVPALSLGGWFWLARHYRDRGPEPTGEAFRGVRAQIGWTGYRGALRVTVTPEALHLSLPRLLRLGHPPLRIPWDALSAVAPGRLTFILGAAFRVAPPGVRVAFFPKPVHDAVRVHVPTGGS